MPQSGTQVGLTIVGQLVGSYWGPTAAYVGGLIGPAIGDAWDMETGKPLQFVDVELASRGP